jgi:hypothetical protein
MPAVAAAWSGGGGTFVDDFYFLLTLKDTIRILTTNDDNEDERDAERQATWALPKI